MAATMGWEAAAADCAEDRRALRAENDRLRSFGLMLMSDLAYCVGVLQGAGIEPPAGVLDRLDRAPAELVGAHSGPFTGPGVPE